ncbi:hypothetical protein GUJ93_ZPchr0001g31056 [Zizania palustris]|uniref:Uncharacterized protein n=1 Tax=Zizania palustris TaxID=103762 RepID=A0A8J5RT42_ZIZPA|nr:hypothetical protein GUJ93_ZPchr0001g31056 [Zizania palustris]
MVKEKNGNTEYREVIELCHINPNPVYPRGEKKHVPSCGSFSPVCGGWFVSPLHSLPVPASRSRGREALAQSGRGREPLAQAWATSAGATSFHSHSREPLVYNPIATPLRYSTPIRQVVIGEDSEELKTCDFRRGSCSI